MKLFYREYGAGQPLIILHGIFGISDNWVSFARKLEKKFHVFIPDQRNHGQSPHDDTFNYFALCADLQEFIETHEMENPIVLGHSMGGKVAMHFALENPDLLKALIVADISMRQYNRRYRHLSMVDAMMAVNFENAQTREDIENQLMEKIPDKRIRQFAMKNLYRRERSQQFAWRLNLEAINLNMDEVFKGIDSKGLFEKPTLFIRGGASDYISYEDFDKIYRHFPKADIKTIEGAGHWLHAEKPDEFFGFFDEFIQSNELMKH
jgi:esterase